MSYELDGFDGPHYAGGNPFGGVAFANCLTCGSMVRIGHRISDPAAPNEPPYERWIRAHREYHEATTGGGGA